MRLSEIEWLLALPLRPTRPRAGCAGERPVVPEENMSQPTSRILQQWSEPIGWARAALDFMRCAGIRRPWGNDPTRIQHLIRITPEGMTFVRRESEQFLPFSEIDYVGFWRRQTSHGEFVGIQVIDKEPDASDFALDTPSRIPALTRVLQEHRITVHDGTGLAQQPSGGDSIEAADGLTETPQQ